MKKIGFSILVFLFYGCAVVASPEKEEGIEAKAVIELVQEVLDDAWQKLESEGLVLSNVTLSLATVLDSKVEGGVKVLFFKAGSNKTESVTSRITVELAPPPDDTKALDVGEHTTKEKIKNVVEAIVTLAKSMNSLKQEKRPLQVTKISGELKFVVTKSTSGGIAGLEILPVSLDLGGSATNAFEQKISFVFIKEYL